MEITFIRKYPNVYQQILAEVDRYPQLITCDERLTEKIVRRLDKYFGVNPQRANHRYTISVIIGKEILQAFKEKKKEIKAVNFDDVIVGKAELIEFEPQDILANVGETALNNISLKEKITDLAVDDSERFVLGAWSRGLSDTEISQELALRFGGNPKSKRIWIQRFRTRCQRKLAA